MLPYEEPLCCRKRILLGMFGDVLVDDSGFEDVFQEDYFTADSNPMVKTAGNSRKQLKTTSQTRFLQPFRDEASWRATSLV